MRAQIFLYVFSCIYERICACRTVSLHETLTAIHIHVIFSSSQIGRFGISQREIGVSDREIFARYKYFIFPSKIGHTDALKDKFLYFWVP